MPGPVITAGTAGVQSLTSGTSVVVPMPSGVAVGDVLIAVIEWHASATDNLTDATGDWTLVRSSATGTSAFKRLATFKRIADGTEDSTYTFSYPTAQRALGIILRCAGASDVDVSALTNTVTSATAQWPAVTTTGADRKLILLAARGFSDTVPLTPPSGGTVLASPRTTSNTFDVVTLDQAAAGVLIRHRDHARLRSIHRTDARDRALG